MIILLLLCLMSNLKADFHDNRFFPGFDIDRNRSHQKSTRFSVWPFGLFAHYTRGDGIKEKKGLFETFGPYNEYDVREAIIITSGRDFFDTPSLINFRNNPDLLWKMNGKLNGQGVMLHCDQRCTPWLSVGCSSLLMHTYTRNNFSLAVNDANITYNDVVALDDARRAMNTFMGIEPALSKKTGLADSEAYMRIGGAWDYTLKCRTLDLGLKIGALIPTGVTKNPFNPASIDFGAQGAWGVYCAADAEIELKEDWFVGGFLRLDQRFDHTITSRLPVHNEQQLYGALQGSLGIQPGPTGIFSFYVALYDLLEGLGARVQYMGTIHAQDGFVDKRLNKTIPLTLGNLFKYSSWKSEYVTVNVFYNAGAYQYYRWLPTLTVAADIPMHAFFSENCPRTTRVSFGLQYSY